MNGQPYVGSEKRNYIRITYRPESRPKLKIGQDSFDVADISESGIRFVNDKRIKLDKRIHGNMTFLYGESVIIEGDIVWEKNGECGLLLEQLIPSEGMENEKKYVILNLNSPLLAARDEFK